MPGTHVDHAADILIRGDHLADLRLADQAHLRLITQPLEIEHIRLKVLHMPRLVGQIAITPGQIAGDAVTLHPLAHQLYRLDAHQLEFAYALLTQGAAELVQIMADAADQLSAVSPTRPPANLASLQQHHG